jgi:FixJ family two-component response regulator
MQATERPQPSPLQAPGPELPTVHLVDDDAMVRAALGRLLASHAYRVCAYASAEEFLARFDDGTPGCLLVDIAMPGIGGLDLCRQLKGEAGGCPPTVFISGMPDIPTCASALRDGAVHFLSKPVDEQELLQALEEAVRHDTVRRLALRHQAMVQARLASLTPREHEVLTHVMRGRLNKQIAADLGTAEKTVKVHRARAMEKMGIRSVAELVKMGERAQPQRAELDARGWGPRDGLTSTQGSAACGDVGPAWSGSPPGR